MGCTAREDDILPYSGVTVIGTGYRSTFSEMSRKGRGRNMQEQNIKEKHAILIAGFGTARPEALERAILPVEQAIQRAAGKIPCFRAFTSPTLRRKLAAEAGILVDSPAQALEKLRRAGFTLVKVQPTLLLPGREYDRLREEISSAAQGMRVIWGTPLLWEDRDLAALAEALLQAYPLPEDTALLLMGHGTGHESDRIYPALRRHLEDLGMALCTLEGGLDFGAALPSLLSGPRRKVCLAPLLLTAGAHAQKDMTGRLKPLLEAAGFQVSQCLTGLGELPAVQEMFAEKAKADPDKI